MDNDSCCSLANLLASTDLYTRQRALSYITAISLTQGDLLLQDFEQIYLYIISLCASNKPEFGTISSIINAISNASYSYPIFFEKYPTEIFHISRTVTETYYRFPTTDKVIPPSINTLAFSLEKHLEVPENFTFQIFLEIVKHCKTGFIPNSSLIPLLLKHINTCINLLVNTHDVDFKQFLLPLASSSREIRLFFLILWSSAVPDLIDHPFFKQSISECSNILYDLAHSGPPESHFAKFLILSITISNSDRLKKISELSKDYFSAIKDEDIQKKNRINMENIKMKTTDHVHHTSVSVLESAFMSKKWGNFDLYLIEAAKVIMWTKDQHRLESGDAYHLSEIKSINSPEPSVKINGKTNIIYISVGKKEYILSFDSPETASQWHNLLVLQIQKLQVGEN